MLPESDAALQCVDGESGDEICVAIRVWQVQIALALALRNDAGIEVVLNSQDCERLMAKLQHDLLYRSVS